VRTSYPVRFVNRLHLGGPCATSLGRSKVSLAVRLGLSPCVLRVLVVVVLLFAVWTTCTHVCDTLGSAVRWQGAESLVVDRLAVIIVQIDPLSVSHR